MRVRLRGHVDLGWREDAWSIASNLVAISVLHIVYANQGRVVHHLEPLEELGVATELLCEEGAYFRTELEFLATTDPAEVFFKHCPLARILTCAFLRIYLTVSATLKS